MALRLQHQTAEIISRANAFLGFAAIGRIKIVQKPVTQAARPAKPSLRALTDRETERVASTVEPIADEALRGRRDMFTGANIDDVHLRLRGRYIRQRQPSSRAPL